MLALILAGCSSQPAVKVTSAPSAAQKAAAIAVQQVGVRYRYGGASPAGFDCSGLVHYAYANAGKRIPRTTAAQWQTMQPVGNNDLRVGDILFFRIAGKISHVGMYVGDGDFVHAPSTGNVVSVASLRSEYYQDAFIRAGRPD
ncbi:MAG: C40 family peptidase [Gammaproteobacteria bacterium]|nr:C40 family peptidase [Gammaproteobacteria bacterium]